MESVEEALSGPQRPCNLCLGRSGAAGDWGAVLRVSDDAVIRLEGVHKWYGQYHALKNINITVLKGERIVICGRSGSGKSTLIRGISRLEEH